jgi:hypothetical protein
MTDKLGETSVAIKKYPTRLSIRCVECGHQGQVEVFLDKPPPSSDAACAVIQIPIVVGRDTMRSWSTRRKGKGNAAIAGKRSRGKSRK